MNVRSALPTDAVNFTTLSIVLNVQLMASTCPTIALSSDFFPFFYVFSIIKPSFGRRKCFMPWCPGIVLCIVRISCAVQNK